MKDDFNALTKSVIALAQSLTDYVCEMGEHDEDAYDSSEEIFEEDVDYTARGEDCYYIPMLEDEIANHYNSPLLQNQEERVRQGDEEQEEPTLAQIMSQIMAMQAQQEKDFLFLMSELHQEKAARKMLETQLAQQASNSYENPEKYPSQPDVSTVDPNTITLKSDKVLKEPKRTDRASTKVAEEDMQPEHGKKKEVEEQEIPYVAPPPYLPPIPFPQRQIKVPIQTIDGDKIIDVCELTFFESKVLSNKHAKNSDAVGNNLNEVVKKSFHKGPEILICNTRLKDEMTTSLPGH